MKIVLAHNYYPSTGGEESVLEEERTLLEQAGHVIIPFFMHTHERGIRDLILCALAVVWNPFAYHKMRQLLRREKPDVVHFHNTFPLFSPAVYWACVKEGVPVVQTLHNYRLMCANGIFLRKGQVCEDCLGRRFAWPAIQNRCYRNSAVGSLLLALMQWIHRVAGTWKKAVHTYIALTEFSRSRFIDGGVADEARIVVKPNFIGNPPSPVPDALKQKKALFVGRLCPEKGCHVLIAGWIKAVRKSSALATYTLYIVGDGQERQLLEAQVNEAGMDSVIKLTGSQSRDEVLDMMKTSRFMVLPSIWYEGFPMTILEAYACGIPVITSRLGSMSSIIEPEETGLFFSPGDVDELADRLIWAAEHETEMLHMGRTAKCRFEEEYSGSRNYGHLMSIYAATQPDSV